MHVRRIGNSQKPGFSRQYNPRRSNAVFGRSGNFKEMAKEILFASFVTVLTPMLIYEASVYFNNPYTALGSKSAFRILILRKGEPKDALQCDLKHVSSFHEVEYEAISYAWRDPNAAGKEVILCNRQQKSIELNLASALRTLRHTNEDRALWADAICINQDDPVERASQVSIMREIYANARKVIIWLGQERDTDQRAFKFLKWLSVHFDQQGNKWQDNANESGPGREWARIKVEQSPDFESLRNLLHREWFTRTWVVQEIASAQSAVLLQGSDTIPWDVVSDVLTKLRHPSFMVSHMEDEKTQAALNSVLAMESARRSVNGTYDLSLFQILLATCFNACSDPRDKIYAVLGLAKDWREKGGLDPDYSRNTTAEEVFKRFAMWDVKKNGQIRILSCTTGSEESTGLPSWVPDWRKIQNTHPFVLYSGRTMFSASGGLSVEAWYSDHGRVLHTIGEVVDSIETVGSELRFFTINPLAELAAWLTECHGQAADVRGGLSDHRYEQFWRTMTCGLTADGFPVPVEYGDYFRRYWDFLRLNAMLTSATLPGSTPESGATDAGLMSHTLIQSSLNKWTLKRRFCTTTGRRLACMPPSAQNGDLICILHGGEVPYLLRSRTDGKYIVVGECYVHGIMHGEALLGDISRLRHFRIV